MKANYFDNKGNDAWTEMDEYQEMQEEDRIESSARFIPNTLIVFIILLFIIYTVKLQNSYGTTK